MTDNNELIPVIIALVTVALIFVLGFMLGRVEITEDCEKLGAFHAGGKVFKCQMEK